MITKRTNIDDFNMRWTKFGCAFQLYFIKITFDVEYVFDLTNEHWEHKNDLLLRFQDKVQTQLVPIHLRHQY